MIGLGTLAKLAKGGLGPDELAAILEAAGMKIELGEVERPSYRSAFGAAGASLLRPGARLVRIQGVMENGDTVQALIVLAPVTGLGDGDHKKMLDS